MDKHIDASFVNVNAKLKQIINTMQSVMQNERIRTKLMMDKQRDEMMGPQSSISTYSIIYAQPAPQAQPATSFHKLNQLHKLTSSTSSQLHKLQLF